MRVRHSVEVAAIHHDNQVLRLTVSIGLANSKGDILDNSAALLDLAEERMLTAEAQGGNCVVGPGDIVVGQEHPAPPSERLVDAAIASIAEGEGDTVLAQLPSLGRRLLPLLRLLNAEYSLGINLVDVEERLGRRASDRVSQTPVAPQT
jgi:hypothetical protein